MGVEKNTKGNAVCVARRLRAPSEGRSLFIFGGFQKKKSDPTVEEMAFRINITH